MKPSISNNLKRTVVTVLASFSLIGIAYSENIQELESKVKQNDISAIKKLAEAYYTGNGVEEVDKEKAAELISRAASLNDGESNFLLAQMYMDGDGVPKNKEKALEYMYTAGDKIGYIPAMHFLMHCCANTDINGNKDDAKKDFGYWADKILSKGDETGDAAFFKARRLKKDDNLDEAVKYYKLSAEKNNIYGMYALANLYMNGQGVPQNYKKAADLYDKTLKLYESRKGGFLMFYDGNDAMQNSFLAHYNLAIAYFTGNGQKVSFTKGMEHAKKTGENVREDIIKAIMFYAEHNPNDKANVISGLREVQKWDMVEVVGTGNLEKGFLYDDIEIKIKSLSPEEKIPNSDPNKNENSNNTKKAVKDILDLF